MGGVFFLRMLFAPDVDSHHGDEDEAHGAFDDVFAGGGRGRKEFAGFDEQQGFHEAPTGDDAGRGPGEEAAKFLPIGVAAIGRDSADIAADEERKDEADGGLGIENDGEEGDGEDTGAGEAGFRDADAEGGEGGDEPLPGC